MRTRTIGSRSAGPSGRAWSFRTRIWPTDIAQRFNANPQLGGPTLLQIGRRADLVYIQVQRPILPIHGSRGATGISEGAPEFNIKIRSFYFNPGARFRSPPPLKQPPGVGLKQGHTDCGVVKQSSQVVPTESGP